MPRLTALLACTLLLAVHSAAAGPSPGASSLTISGAVEHPRSLSTEDLGRVPATTETVFMHTGHGVLAGSFSGALLWTLLQQSGIKTDPAAKNDIIRHSVVITGRDGYSTVLSLGEISPEFGADLAIIATSRDGKPMTGPDGFNRLVIPGDKAGGRSIENVVTIEVR